MKSKSTLKKVADLLAEKVSQIKEAGELPYINHEFQDYGYRLALRLDDPKHKALYIKLAKSYPRAILEDAAAFTDTYTQAKSKGKVFMWKVHELMADYKLSHPNFKISKSKTKQSAENLTLI